MAKLVNRLLRQAGIGAPCSGAYVLQHTLATTMVRSGASFKEVAVILGHGSLTTTGIYAKLDLPSLAEAKPARYVAKPSERGPVDAISGACRVVRGLSKPYAVRKIYARLMGRKGIYRQL
jgi:hypothetical protein